MVYDHVARRLVSAYAGDPGSLPATIAAGSQHSYTFNWTLPANYDPEYSYVVGYITNAATGEILNAGKSAYLPGNTNAQPMFVTEGRTNGLVGVTYQYDILVHDPDNLELTISAVDIPSWMTLNTTGPVTATLSGTPSTEGVFTVTLMVSDGNSSRQQQFEVEVINSEGVDWYLVGNEGFTEDTASSLDMEINNSGIPYVMSVSSFEEVSVYRFENDTWSRLGNLINGEESQAAMALAPDGTPYVVTRSGGLKVYRFDGNSWLQVGGSLGDGFHIDITVADNGTPYVSFMDIAADPKGICKKWDGTTWTTVGGTHFTASQVAVWTKVTTNSSNQPVVLYGTGPGSNGPFSSTVSQFDGSNWQILGGGAIDANTSTYFSHSMVMDANDNIYVSLTANLASKQLNVYKWNGSVWNIIGEDISGGDTYSNSIALDLDGNPAIGFRDELEGGKTTVMRFDQGIWSPIGLTGFTHIASYQSLAYSPNGEPYIAYQDEENNQKATVKRYGDDGLGSPDFSSRPLEVKLFPNPNAGQFTVLTKEGGRFRFSDMAGRTIFQGNLKTGASENGRDSYLFDFSNLSPGLYLLNIYNEQRSGVVKVVIE